MAISEITVKTKTNKVLLYILKAISFFKIKPSKWFLKSLSKIHIAKIRVNKGEWKYIYVDLWQRLAK